MQSCRLSCRVKEQKCIMSAKEYSQSITITTENSASHAPKCIRCFVVLSSNVYQQIFDETGKELELPSLLLKCFNIDIKEDKLKIQALCNECVSELIETYDVMQKEDGGGFKSHNNDNYDIDNEIENETAMPATHYCFHDKHAKLNCIKEINNSGEKEELIENFDIVSNQTEVGEDASREDDILSSNEEREDEDDDDDSNIRYENISYLDSFDENFDFKTYKQKVIKNHKFDEIEYPKSIKCKFCSELLDDHLKTVEHTKQMHCKNNDDNASNLLYPCVVDEMCTSLHTLEDLSLHLVFKHYSLENLIILSECPECNQFFYNFPAYNKHCCAKIKHHHRSTLECEKCGRYFKSNKRYRFHLQFHLEKRRPKACFICDTIFRDEDEFFEHVKYGHEQDVENVCKSCDLIFTSKKNLNNHIVGSHSNAHSYNCSQCFKSFSSISYLRQHKMCHEKKLYKCHICDKELTRKSRLKKHLINHQKPIPTKVSCCNDCGFVASSETEMENCKKTYQLWTSLNLHKTTQHVLRNNLNCPKCSLEFLTSFDYKSHLIEHHQDTIFDCQFCIKSFKTKSALNLHIKKMHNKPFGEEYETKKIKKSEKISNAKSKLIKKNHSCKVCNKVFSSKYDADSHERAVHIKEPRFFCPNCSFKTPYKQTLTYHMKTHKQEYPYECSKCSRKFRFKIAYQLHEQRHTNIKNFVCNINGCTMSYINIGRLKTHQKHKHFTSTSATNSKHSQQSLRINNTFKIIASDVFIDDDDGLDVDINDNAYDNGKLDSEFNNSLGEKMLEQQLSTENNPEPEREFRYLINENEETCVISSQNSRNNEHDNKSNEEEEKVFNTAENKSNRKEFFVNSSSSIDVMDLKKPVLIVRNSDYILKLDHTKIYGSALEVTSNNVHETEVGAMEIVGE